MSNSRFVYVTYIKTTPERLWFALTDKAFTQQYWLGACCESDWKAGLAVEAELYGRPDRRRRRDRRGRSAASPRHQVA
jgi:uncharacterized protein YndB with AHSA1/START domain